MPENAEAESQEGRDASDFVSKADYQKLQRKLSQKSKREQEQATRIAGVEASQRRMEAMFEKALDMFSVGDDTASRDVAEFKQRVSAQRTKDMSTTQVQERLNSIMDEHDVDFESDSRLSDARKLVREMEETGNYDLLDQVEKIIKDVVSSPDDTDVDAEPDAEAASRRERARVDTNKGSAPNSPTSRADVARMDPRTMTVKEMREVVNKAQDEYYR